MKVLLLFVGKANGSSDRLVADMDDQSRQVEDGIASALCHSLPLLNMVIRDAAAQTTRPVCCCCTHLTHFEASLQHACSICNIATCYHEPLFPQRSGVGLDRQCMVLIAASMGILGKGKLDPRRATLHWQVMPLLQAMKLLANQLHRGSSATLHTDYFMFDTQAMKSQALTLLASWVVAEPSLAVANKLHQQDLPNRILEDLVNRAHEYLPGPAAGAAVQVPLHCKYLRVCLLAACLLPIVCLLRGCVCLLTVLGLPFDSSSSVSGLQLTWLCLGCLECASLHLALTSLWHLCDPLGKAPNSTTLMPCQH